MAQIIINSHGETADVGDIEQVFADFKEQKSRLDYRDRQNIGVSAVYDWVRGLGRAYKDRPERGTREYNQYIDALWKKEPILAGTVYGQQAVAQTKPWVITGGRNSAGRAARMLQEAQHSFFKSGWWGFAGVSALDFYTCPMGAFWGAQRQGNDQYGALVGLEHIDSHTCTYTGKRDQPIDYNSEVTGQTIHYRIGEIINLTSLALSREREFGTGFCAVERAMRAANILVLLHDYEDEKLRKLPPQGIGAITGLTSEEVRDAIALYEAQKKNGGANTFAQILFLVASRPDVSVDVKLTPFSTLPDQFDRNTLVIEYVNVLANAFGISASDIWFMGGGMFGTGKEAEMQHIAARGKSGEWFSAVQYTLNREMPKGVVFSFDTQDIEEDATAAATAGAWVNTYTPLMQQSEQLGISAGQWKRLLVEKNVIPKWMIDDETDANRTIIQSGSLKEAQDVVSFLFEMGQVVEITPYVLREETKLLIRGKPIPATEVDRGAKPTKKAILAEQRLWGSLPELQRQKPPVAIDNGDPVADRHQKA